MPFFFLFFFFDYVLSCCFLMDGLGVEPLLQELPEDVGLPAG